MGDGFARRVLKNIGRASVEQGCGVRATVFFAALPTGSERKSGSGGDRRPRRADCQIDAERGKKGGGASNGASRKRVGIKKTQKSFLFFFFLEFFSGKGAYFPEENAFWRRNCNKIRNGVETTSTAPKRRAAFDESRYYLTRRDSRSFGKVGKTNAKKRLVGRLSSK